MIKPAIPRDEAKRLAGLYGLNVLDTPVEERFDRITRLASKVFEVPIAVISLVDENREWYKSCQGIEVKEGGRDVSFCGHAILSDAPFIIPDASRDERFADNPQVIGPMQIRFYAGCALHAQDGSRVGTLCIKDRRSRQLSDPQVEALKDLSAIAEQELNSLTLEQACARLAEARAQIEQEKLRLEAMNQFMVGREHKMMELKGEIDGLLRELGRPPKYSG